MVLDRWKMEAQMTPTSPKSHLMRCCEGSNKYVFYEFGVGKQMPEIENVSHFGRQLGSKWFFGEGSAEEAACQGGERLRVIENY